MSNENIATLTPAQKTSLTDIASAYAAAMNVEETSECVKDVEWQIAFEAVKDYEYEVLNLEFDAPRPENFRHMVVYQETGLVVLVEEFSEQHHIDALHRFYQVTLNPFREYSPNRSQRTFIVENYNGGYSASEESVHT